MKQDFTYFDHDADIGIIGHGPTLEAAIVAAAEAMFSIMSSLHAVVPAQCVDIAFDESDAELALVTWLNLLLVEAREQGMVFSRFQLTRQGAHWQGRACGEPWRDGLERGTEVKGATLTMLSVKQAGDGWTASCVVDV
jgi:SHS2 domain-containing protein